MERQRPGQVLEQKERKAPEQDCREEIREVRRQPNLALPKVTTRALAGATNMELASSL
jgi:hypothetical protein